MSSVSYPLSFFLGVLFQTVLVGSLIPLLITASYAQWKKASSGQGINLVMAFTTVFFGLSTTVHWILGLRRLTLATLYLPPGMTMGMYIQPPYSTDEIVRRAIFQLQIVVGDLIMIYRMYHIYERSLLACVIPSITTAGLFAIGCGTTNSYRNLSTPADLTASNKWVAACFCVTLFNSAFMSGAIGLRLWKVYQETIVVGTMKRDSVILRAMRVLVESAALWTLFVSMNFFAFLAGSNLRYTFLSMTGPVAGISFCLIIVRLGTMTPEVCEDTWESSQRTRISRALPSFSSRLSKVPFPLHHVKVEQEYISDMEFRVIDPSSPDADGKRSPVH